MRGEWAEREEEDKVERGGGREMKGAGASAQLRLQNIRGASASDFKISEVGHVFVPGGCFNRDKSSPNGPGWWLQPGPILFVPVRATNRDKRKSFDPGWWL